MIELRKQTEEIAARVQKLTITAPGQGKVARLLPDNNHGRFLEEGTPVGVVVDGRPLLRTWLNEEQLGSIVKDAGTEIRFRVPGRTMTTHVGRIVSVEPAAEDVFNNLALTYVAGGEILVDPETGKPLEPIFQIDIEPADQSLKLSEHGARVNLQLPRRYESIAGWTLRRCVRFVHKLLIA